MHTLSKAFSLPPHEGTVPASRGGLPWGDLDGGLVFLKEAAVHVNASLAGKVPSWSGFGADLGLGVQGAMYEKALTPNIMYTLCLLCLVSAPLVLKRGVQ